MTNRQKNETEKATAAAMKEASRAAASPYRPRYHIMPASGWLNDPNGLIQYRGRFHVFYQHHPFAPAFGSMHWGHVVSSDLVHWERLPVALAPDPAEEEGCFSGSAVARGGTLALLYTSHSDRRDPKEQQCLALSRDGVRFLKSTANPVIPRLPANAGENGLTGDFRDPKVFWDRGCWNLVAGASADGKGLALLYRSRSLTRWRFQGVLCQSDGTQGSMWECPDFFPLGGRHVLMISPMNMPGHKNLFLIGEYDAARGRFSPQAQQEADFGHDFYAAQTFETADGRRVLIGWMDAWDDVFPTRADGWAGALTLPRELSLDSTGRVRTRPVREAELLRKNRLIDFGFRLIHHSAGNISEITGDSLEIALSALFDDPSCREFVVVLRASPDGGCRTELRYLPQERRLTLDTTRAGAGRTGTVSVQLAAPEPEKTPGLRLRIYVDRCSLEIFVNDGETVLSERIYPARDALAYDLRAVGGDCEMQSVAAWELEDIWEPGESVPGTAKEGLVQNA